MKKYYLHNGTESSGPFDIEELKAQKITTKTPMWFEGLEHWTTAGEIEELRPVFKTNPPPIDSFTTTTSIPPSQKTKKNTEERKILGLSKNVFFMVCVFLVVAIGTIVLNTLNDNRSRELDLQNHKTEVENYQLDLKQKEIEDEKIQAVLQEKIDSERMAQDRKQSANNRLLEIDKVVANYQKVLDSTKDKLDNISGFKLLRTAEEKKEQMNLLQKNMDSFKNQISQLKEESDQLKLELEKIK